MLSPKTLGEGGGEGLDVHVMDILTNYMYLLCKIVRVSHLNLHTLSHTWRRVSIALEKIGGKFRIGT